MSVVPGYQIGLKLWSVNTGESQREARRLYDAGVYDYLELYAVPGSADTLPGWKSLQIPSIIHAAHFKHGFNLAKVDCASANRRIYDEMRRMNDTGNLQVLPPWQRICRPRHSIQLQIIKAAGIIQPPGFALAGSCIQRP